MIYLFKTHDLLDFKDFNLFTAIEMIDEETSNWKCFNNMEDLEDFLIEDHDETADYIGEIDEDRYLVIVDTDNQTISKVIYTVRLEAKIIDSDEEIQALIDKEAKMKEEKIEKIEEEFQKSIKG